MFFGWFGQNHPRAFKKFLNHPNNSGRFYLIPKDSFDEGCWYYSRPMGHNSISKIMKEIVQNTPVSCDKKVTNHSGRKTLVKKLKAAQVPESSIIKVTGHTSTRGLRNYDPGHEQEFRQMSNAILAPAMPTVPATVTAPAPLAISNTVSVPAAVPNAFSTPMAFPNALWAPPMPPSFFPMSPPFQFPPGNAVTMTTANDKIGISKCKCQRTFYPSTSPIKLPCDHQ